MRRRDFLKKTVQGAAALATASDPLARAARAAVSPNEKVTLAVIGCGGMGGRHLEILSANPEVNVAAVCDVYKPRYLDWADKVEKLSGKKPDGYQDFRNVLDRKDIDAVFVVTPDHWHPLLTILACQAAKDVYVEKPVCTVVEEGRAMVETARRYGRVVQAGTQQRSMPVFQEAIKVLRSGRLGQITNATAWVGVNEWGVGENPGPIPEGLDWDLWLGPAPYVPYSRERQFGFMGWWDYARGGQLTNWGIHLMDIVQWGIGQDRPLSVCALGGSYRGGAGADNHETIEAFFEYPDCTVTWEQRPWNIHANKGYGIKFQGTEGQLFVDRSTVVVKPDKLGIKEIVGEPEKSWANPEHHANFFHCIRTRERPVADIEQGFRSTTAVLLAGIALKTKRKLYWDGDAERFLRDEQANRYLSRPYRPPWHL
ncbi:MAG: Gfo/Idh/MocA family oxidoreductase [Candidatus Omnitrophica bacterium]|nr:Inositol 2-dehydrogenase/D-chiro-inositol 3-dehydrogenase [bacterium]NUN94926.1 Gfo/Idh/MocA family oxidoreductase [Candidatus Omnitrophota bacterium]